jgi:hypothetical protein
VSRLNKVNPDHYTMAGRLSADDLARERMRQAGHQTERGKARNRPVPPWMAKEAANDRGRAEDTGSDRGEVTARKKAHPAPRRTVTGEAPATARRKTTKAAGATGTPKTRKAPAARASAARGASEPRAAASRTRTGRTKGTGVTRKKPKKNRS